jgi:hypothetical protein
MRLGRANVVEVAFGKQPNISTKQPIPVVLLFENGMSAAVRVEDFAPSAKFFIRSSITDKLAVADFSLPRITIQSNMIAAAKQCPLTACSGVFLQALAQRQQRANKKRFIIKPQ